MSRDSSQHHVVVLPDGDATHLALEDDAEAVPPWRMTAAHPGEHARWESLDGRWVALARGHGISAGAFLVVDSRGRCESADSLEDALALARAWRT
jgi:hypothetical protein